ncbi:hypothetical protein [Negadavirga shengliensis]|uniref:SusD-like starch-binding protein associating with outer membrane n=1 Tax=Negadavirga shengliensis TaxID=1389218 RepID=A0ABV9T2M9_9BACT
MKNLSYIFLMVLLISVSGCEMFNELDVENENSPNLSQVFADPQEYPSLLVGSYRIWWNQSIGPNPNYALSTAAEASTSGYGSWGMGDYYRVPRQPINNVNVDDPVLDPVYGSWYAYYAALPAVNNIIKGILEGNEVMVGNDDYTQGTLAHAYFLQGLIYGHLAITYDKAFLITENTVLEEFEYEFTEASDLLDFALSRMDQAIEICNTHSFSDPVSMLNGNTFDNASLAAFINANAARILAASARTAADTQSIDWNRIKNYAENGITSDFTVFGEVGWVGLAISRDTNNIIHLLAWDWIRVHSRILNMMAPRDPNAPYPWPNNTMALGEINSPDNRLNTDMEYAGQHPAWNPAVRGYHVLSMYKYTRFFESFGRTGTGPIHFFLKAENDLLLAEALLRTGGNSPQVADLVNNTRVGRGQLTPMTGSESPEEALDKLFYERYVELSWTYPLLPYFDRRRTDDLMPGTARQLPIPAKELILNGFEVYTFGGN